jgi:hypothetical protein
MSAAKTEYIVTIDMQSDFEILKSPLITYLRLPQNSKVMDLVEKHRSSISSSLSSLKLSTNPEQDHTEGYSAWIKHILETKQVTSKGDSVGIPSFKVPSAVLKTYSSWLHE